jgi:hypothetical protein
VFTVCKIIKLDDLKMLLRVRCCLTWIKERSVGVVVYITTREARVMYAQSGRDPAHCESAFHFT